MIVEKTSAETTNIECLVSRLSEKINALEKEIEKIKHAVEKIESKVIPSSMASAPMRW